MANIMATRSQSSPRQRWHTLLVTCAVIPYVTAFVAKTANPLQIQRAAPMMKTPLPPRLEFSQPLYASFSESEARLMASSKESIWEKLASAIVKVDYDAAGNPLDTATFKQYVQIVSTLRVGIPSLVTATISKLAYPGMSMAVAAVIHDPAVFDVVANDYSQYIQNVLTTSGLVFSLLIGQTYYFMVRIRL